MILKKNQLVHVLKDFQNDYPNLKKITWDNLSIFDFIFYIL